MRDVERKLNEKYFQLFPSISHYPSRLDSLNFENLSVVTASADDDYLGGSRRAENRMKLLIQ